MTPSTTQRKKRINAASVSKALKENSTRSVRFQLTLKARYAEKLKTLKELSKLSSYAEVLRESLRIYEGILRHSRLGDSVFIQKADGTKIELLL